MRRKFILAAAGAVTLTGAVSGMAFAGSGGVGGDGGVGGINIGVPIGGDGGTGATATNTPTINGGSCAAGTGANAGGCTSAGNSRFGAENLGGGGGGKAGAVRTATTRAATAAAAATTRKSAPVARALAPASSAKPTAVGV